jgi:2-amino-4-hydroxy-6-hydroxymethyldihydropteridine diphosphokinase
MATTYILLGGNIDDRFYYLKRGEKLINTIAGNVLQRSSYYETEPWGFQHKNKFLNCVLKVETNLSPMELLLHINQIENMMGRIRHSDQYIERNIDIDILYFDDLIVSERTLVVPHPKIQFRKFTLAPLAEIAPDYIHPILQKSTLQLLAECTDQLSVNVISEPKEE